MTFWESKLGAVLGVLLVAWVLAVCLAGVRVHLATHPEREAPRGVEFESMFMGAEEIGFPSVDGTQLVGWVAEGDPGRPPVLLCHDLGSSKASLVGLGLELHGRGFTVLLFDFRGHGQSEGRSSTLGLKEKRDILGALDYLAQRLGREIAGVGVYGAGMGAHAAVLAAADRPALKVLVLDGLYPDASHPLAREVFAGWEPGMRRLRFLSNGMFALLNRTRIGDHRAADVIPRLLGRDMLLLAPADDPHLTADIERMLQSIPEQRNFDGNMVVLPSTQGAGLYGAALDRHRKQVAGFLESRLGVWSVAAAVPR
jgi:pimeloyl-ACP methyl ester carboxylesterase